MNTLNLKDAEVIKRLIAGPSNHIVALDKQGDKFNMWVQHGEYAEATYFKRDPLMDNWHPTIKFNADGKAITQGWVK